MTDSDRLIGLATVSLAMRRLLDTGNALEADPLGSRATGFSIAITFDEKPGREGSIRRSVEAAIAATPAMLDGVSMRVVSFGGNRCQIAAIVDLLPQLEAGVVS